MSFDEVKAVETLDQAIVALQKIVDRGVRFLHWNIPRGNESAI